MEYSSPKLRVRVSKDRGQFLCDFAAPTEPTEWFDQEVVFRDLGEDLTIDALISQGWSSLEAVAHAVEDHLDRVIELFGDRYLASRNRFQVLKQIRVKKLFGGHVP